jgi:hypothetical protein
LRENTFLSGDWRTAEKGQEHINGFFFVRRADLMSVKGFNEYITTYGWDDDDIYFRLEQHGFNRVRISTNGVYHIPHGDAQRVGGQSPSTTALEELRAYTGTKIMGNRFLAAAMPMWGKEKFFLPIEIVRHSENYLEAQQVGESFHQVPDHIRADAEYYGMATALSWTTELSAYHITKANLYALLASRCCGGRCYPGRCEVGLRVAKHRSVGIEMCCSCFLMMRSASLRRKRSLVRCLERFPYTTVTRFLSTQTFFASVEMGCAQEAC